MQKIIFLGVSLLACAFNHCFAQTGGAKFSTYLVAAITYEQANPTNIEAYNMAPFTKGLNWEKYKTAAITRGCKPFDILETSTTIQFLKGCVPALIPSFDIVVLQHPPHPKLIDVLKRSAPATKIISWTMFDAVPQYPAWHPWAEIQRSAAKSNLLRGTKANTYNCFVVDVYETSPGAKDCGQGVGEKPHVWNVDVTNPIYAHDFAALVNFMLSSSEYFSGRLDGYFFDNVFSNPYWGTATNAPPNTPQYAKLLQDGWRIMLSRQQVIQTQTWGNSGDTGVSVYTKNTLPRRFAEHFFRRGDMESIGVDEARGKMNEVAYHNLIMTLSLTPDSRNSVTAWAKGNEKQWSELLSYAQSMGTLAHFYVNSGRTGMYLFWNESIRQP